jgi:hypothetical protein
VARTSESNATVARGAALVAVAVLAGLFLLRNGLDTEVTRTADRDTAPITAPEEATDAETTDPEVTEPDPEATDEGPVAPADPEPADAPRPRDQLSVIVLNGSGLTGAAGRWSDGIGEHGYQMQSPGNANARVEVTQVMFQPGFDADAVRLVADLGAPAGVSAQALPPEPPGDIGEAQIVVVVGPDIADGDPPPPTG